MSQAIRNVREAMVPELSQEKLALAAGVSTSYLSDVELQKRPKFSWEILASIVDALEVDLTVVIAEARNIPPGKAASDTPKA